MDDAHWELASALFAGATAMIETEGQSRGLAGIDIERIGERAKQAMRDAAVLVDAATVLGRAVANEERGDPVG
jgi:hypothetical protein